MPFSGTVRLKSCTVPTMDGPFVWTTANWPSIPLNPDWSVPQYSFGPEVEARSSWAAANCWTPVNASKKSDERTRQRVFISFLLDADSCATMLHSALSRENNPSGGERSQRLAVSPRLQRLSVPDKIVYEESFT